jgi:hypothetical protein
MRTHWIERGMAMVPADAAVLSGPGVLSVAALLSVLDGTGDVSPEQETAA